MKQPNKGDETVDHKVDLFFRSMRDKRVLFCGVGMSNIQLVYRFLEGGAEVTVCDRRTREQLGQTADEIEAAGGRLQLGDDYLSRLDGDIVFRSPGISFSLPEFTGARRKGVVVTSEMEVFFDLCPAKIIAVTGSDGKTTTSTLIAKMLEAAGHRVFLGGNIGKALLPQVGEMTDEDFVVAELSSFQLLSMRKGPLVAVVTNVAPNHLDIHTDMDEYIGAKKNVFLHQNAFSHTVLNADNAITAGFADEVRGQTLLFSQSGAVVWGAFLAPDGGLTLAQGKETTRVMHRSEIRLPGKHNVDNYLTAMAALSGIVPPDCMRSVAREFGGVEHRIEFVRDIGGVRYYNDSIATSPTRAMAGLMAFDQKSILICGGYDKHIPFDEMADTVCRQAKLVIVTGDTADAIERCVRASALFETEGVVILHADALPDAVTIARERAVSGDVVLLSPACASFDKYPNFEARGRHFKELVAAF